MATVTNVGFTTRHWNQLTNTETGRTLELAPGESAETDLPGGFSDPYLSTDGEVPVVVEPTPKPVEQSYTFHDTSDTSSDDSGE